MFGMQVTHVRYLCVCVITHVWFTGDSNISAVMALAADGAATSSAVPGPRLSRTLLVFLVAGSLVAGSLGFSRLLPC